VNDHINRTEFANPPFNLAIEPFDFSVSLGVFHPSDNMFDVVLIEERLERVMSMFPVPG
jgi:hypothetical protein